MIFIIYYEDFYNQFLIKTCLICKKLTENSESVRKWLVSVIVQKHILRAPTLPPIYLRSSEGRGVGVSGIKIV